MPRWCPAGRQSPPRRVPCDPVHFIVLGETHLRRILRTYARYYNDIRTHWSLDKDAPVARPVQRTGIISSCPILGGLHHHYAVSYTHLGAHETRLDLVCC